MSAERESQSAIHPFARRFLFLDTPAFKTRVFFALAAAFAVLILIDFAGLALDGFPLERAAFQHAEAEPGDAHGEAYGADGHAHAAPEMESVRGFYALFGFAAFAFVVLTGWPLRRLLARPETYYGDEGDDA